MFRPIGAYVAALLVGAVFASVGIFWEHLSLAVAALGHGVGVNDPVVQAARVVFVFAFASALAAGFFAAPVILVAVWAVRRFELPRGWSDASGGMIFGAAAAVYVAIFSVAGSLIGWLVLLTAGVLAGLTYWYLAGRPKPPY